MITNFDLAIDALKWIAGADPKVVDVTGKARITLSQIQHLIDQEDKEKFCEMLK